MLSVVMLSVVMLSVVMLSVIMLCVVAPVFAEIVQKTSINESIAQYTRCFGLNLKE
jgi:hypothetical protein